MTEIQRLLCLDAALTSLEGYARAGHMLIPDGLYTYLETRFQIAFPNFGDFLAAQKEAVELLAKNPQVFGGNI